ncbi:MAG: trypsin-like peptidase domain-containing protein [Planctomycetota bacterium]
MAFTQATPLLAQPASVAALAEADRQLSDLIAQAEKSVVAITRQPTRFRNQPAPGVGARVFNEFRDPLAGAQTPLPAGAGVIIDPAGLVVTQYLVIGPGERHTVTTTEGRSFPAEVVAADPRSGLATLAVKQEGLPALPIGRAETLRKGSSVVCIGNPQAIVTDGQPTASYGRVTNLARKAGPMVNLNNTQDDTRGDFRTTLHHFGALIQTDAKLGWNAHGGAVINLDGELVGLATPVSVIAGHEQPAGYAIPFNEAFRRILETLKQGKEVEYGLLGVTFNARPAGARASGPPGIVVQHAYAAGPAGRAGLQGQDLITRIDGKPVPDADRLQLVVGSQPPGAKLEVEFLRGGERQRAQVVLGKFYAAGNKIVTTPAPRWRGLAVDYATAIPSETLATASRQGLIDPEGCVVVSDVQPESVSWKQGVRPGVFLSHVGGSRVSTPEEFWAAIKRLDADDLGKSVSLRFTQSLTPPDN